MPSTSGQPLRRGGRRGRRVVAAAVSMPSTSGQALRRMPSQGGC